MKIDNKNTITIKNLYSVYNEKTPQEFVVLRDINYTFKKGLIYFIIGKSGCGKSTLLSYFNGLSYPQYGSIIINDFDLDSKKNLNQTILCETNGINIHNKLFKNLDANKKVIYLVCAHDANKHLVSLKFSSLKRENIYAIKKVSKKYLDKHLVNSGHQVYALVVDSDYCSHFDVIPMSQINLPSTTIDTGKRFESHKIKNYKELRKQVGVVYQFPEYQLFKATILDDVAFGPINLGMDKEKAKDVSIETLKYMGIGQEYLDKSPFGLSGGQKRRVALSGILAIQPEILVFDEPTAGLDPKGEREMLNIILEAKKQGKTTFVVTHSMEQVLDIADEVIVLDDGQIIKAGTPYEIFKDEKITETASVVLPKTISFINDLIKKDPKYKVLYDMEPRNAKELVDCLIKIKKGGK